MATIKPQTFLAIEDTFVKQVTKSVYKKHSSEIKAVAALLAKGDYNAAYLAIRKLEFSDGVSDARKYIQLLSVEAVIFGASQFSPSKKTKVFSDGVPDLVNTAIERLESSLSQTITNMVVTMFTKQADALRLATETEAYKSAKKPITKAKVNEFVSFAKKEITDSTRLTSSLHSSRLSSFGLLSEASLLGVAFFKYDAILDVKVCPICKHLDGKTFEVSKSLPRVTQLLEADPQDLKVLSSFPLQTKAAIEAFKKLDAQDLENYGFTLPPMHPLCRCLVRKTDTVVEATTPAPADIRALMDSLEDPVFPLDVVDDAEGTLSDILGVSVLVSEET